MRNKELYKMFCKSRYIPIFSQPWWLDAVCGEDNWDVYIVKRDNNLYAAMPYFFTTNEKGDKSICRAHMTQNNGILIKYPDNQSIIKRQAYEEKIMNEICDFIEENFVKYDQQFHYSFKNWLPFFWRYYSESIKYTYVIENTLDLSRVWNDFSPKLRNTIRKAEKANLEIGYNMDNENFYKVNSMTFTRQGREIPFSYDFFNNLDEVCRKEKCCINLYAKDELGNIHAVEYLVWDDESMYLLFSGSNPDFRNSQANDLLIYESIKLASKMNLRFDFEGSVVKNVNHAYRVFGGIPKPYFRIWKEFR